MQTLATGQRFARYRALRWLGSGTAGESYEAEDILLQRKVVLKLIHPWSRLPDAARRQFFREMQGISVLTHAYLAAVLDYGEVDGQLYIARRYVGPGSLPGNEGRIWFHPPLAAIDAIYYIHQLAQALDYIHSCGYLHGSLSFTNVLVLRGPNLDNEPDFAPFLLADVGTAHFVRRCGQPRIKLLPVTAAPEQTQGHATPASDQYALAVLLYFWLSGRPPFLGSAEEIERAKRARIIPALTALSPRVTLEQEQVVLRALSADPLERYPSVLAFAEALQRTLMSLASVTEEPHALSQLQPPGPQIIPLPTPEPEPAPQPEPEPQVMHQPPPDPEPSPIEPAPASQPEQSQQSEPANEQAMSPLTHARLIITSPYTPEPREITLEREEMTLGRAGSSDILLDQDTLTSRHHALLTRSGNSYCIADLRSAHGVFINGQKIPGETACALADGDHITIGEYELIFHDAPAQEAAQAASEQAALPAP